MRVRLSERHAFFHDARDFAALAAFAYRQRAVQRPVHAAVALTMDIAKDEAVLPVPVLDQEEALLHTHIGYAAFVRPLAVRIAAALEVNRACPRFPLAVIRE